MTKKISNKVKIKTKISKITKITLEADERINHEFDQRKIPEADRKIKILMVKTINLDHEVEIKKKIKIPIVEIINLALEAKTKIEALQINKAKSEIPKTTDKKKQDHDDRMKVAQD
jgi:hypothetical protein